MAPNKVAPKKPEKPAVKVALRVAPNRKAKQKPKPHAPRSTPPAGGGGGIFGMIATSMAFLFQQTPRYKIARLIRQLGGKQSEPRMRAYKALVKIGPAALPQLEKALSTKNVASVYFTASTIYAIARRNPKDRQVNRTVYNITCSIHSEKNPALKLKKIRLLGNIANHASPAVRHYVVMTLARIVRTRGRSADFNVQHPSTVVTISADALLTMKEAPPSTRRLAQQTLMDVASGKHSTDDFIVFTRHLNIPLRKDEFPSESPRYIAAVSGWEETETRIRSGATRMLVEYLEHTGKLHLASKKAEVRIAALRRLKWLKKNAADDDAYITSIVITALPLLEKLSESTNKEERRLASELYSSIVPRILL